jgi:hypothetical protein
MPSIGLERCNRMASFESLYHLKLFDCIHLGGAYPERHRRPG